MAVTRRSRLRITVVTTSAGLAAVGTLVAGPSADAHTGATAAAHATQDGKQAVATGRGGAVASVDLDATRAGIATLRATYPGGTR